MEGTCGAFSQANWMGCLGVSRDSVPDFSEFIPMYHNTPPYFFPLISKTEENLATLPVKFEEIMDRTLQTDASGNDCELQNRKSERTDQSTPLRKMRSRTYKSQVQTLKQDDEGYQQFDQASGRKIKNKKSAKGNDEFEGNQLSNNRIRGKIPLLSFISNKIVKFIGDIEASRHYVSQILVSQEKNQKTVLPLYYKYAREFSDKLKNKIALYKFRELWAGPVQGLNQQHQFFHYIIRCLSKIYLQRKFNSILFSYEKFNSQERVRHLQMKQCLLLNIEQPNNFKSYKQFF